MTKPRFKTVTRTQGNNAALKAGQIAPDGFVFDFEEVPILVKGFRKMVRELAYDISEMALTTYLCAKAHGVEFTALPIFLVRDFHHGAVIVRKDSGLIKGSDFAGKRIGVNRGYTVTTGVWARAILQEEAGLDLSQVTWVPSGDEHVERFEAPENVDLSEMGYDLEAAMISGQLGGSVGAKVVDPSLRSFYENPFEAGVNALKSRGLYPINHVMVIKNSILAQYPDLAAQVFNVFSASKQNYVKQLKAGQITDLTAADKVHLAAMELMTDPLPYGIEPNLRTLETLMAHAITQKIIPKPMALEDLFVPSTHNLVG